MKSRCQSIAICLFVSLFALTACSSDSTNASATTSSVGVTSETSIAQSTTIAGDDVVNAQLIWVMDLLNGAETSSAEYAAHVDQAFLNAVPYETGFLPQLIELQAGDPYEIVEVEQRSGHLSDCHH